MTAARILARVVNLLALPIAAALDRLDTDLADALNDKPRPCGCGGTTDDARHELGLHAPKEQS